MHVDWTLFAKFFQERCTEEERQQIESWRKSDPEHQKFFEELTEIWQKSGDLYAHYQVDKAEGWDKLSKKLAINIDNLEVKSKQLKTIMRWVAIFLIVISVGVVAMYITNKLQTDNNVSYVAGNEKTDLILPDRSMVTLNKHAQIRYNKNFEGNYRVVELKGSAYFSVKANKQKPFIVNMQSCSVRVLGTSFYLNSDTVDRVSLIVESGKVQFYSASKKDSFIIVTKNEKAVCMVNNGRIVKNESFNPNEIVWKTGNFIFEDETLLNVSKILSQYYVSKVSISDTSLQNLRLTASFRNQKLADIIEAIKVTFDIKADTVDHKIVLSK
jgi:ferric-dicitrate binding protein FerR (iron transport regulator)